MKPGRPAWAVTAVVACSSAATPRLVAQVKAAVDLGVSNVHYDGFLPSTAAAVSPSFRWAAPRSLVLASGSYLRFASGHRSLQGNMAGSIFSAPLGALTGELSLLAGASRYQEFTGFSHALLTARLHIDGARAGAWIGGTSGTTSFVQAQRPVGALSGGGWTRLLSASWLANATYTRVGDSAYTDVEGAARAVRGRFTFDGSLGARVWSRGGGHGVYGEASGSYAVGPWIALVLAGGRYPTDPTRGSVAGRYLTLSLRLSTLPGRRPAPLPAVPRPALHHSPPDAEDPPAVSAALEDNGEFVIHAAARTVEIEGDFTDWQPLPLTEHEPAAWTLPIPLAAGTYRFSIRIDGGAWFAPAGVTKVPDEFGPGTVGLLTVP
ncbi:MAG TPA: glycogen-binding domain-containing protein [Gemmatimonadales bacterium]|nr:glycogen-binding domain-containing protein [Gemmatimonadales bacterium]